MEAEEEEEALTVRVVCFLGTEERVESGNVEEMEGREGFSLREWRRSGGLGEWRWRRRREGRVAVENAMEAMVEGGAIWCRRVRVGRLIIMEWHDVSEGDFGCGPLD